MLLSGRDKGLSDAFLLSPFKKLACRALECWSTCAFSPSCHYLFCRRTERRVIVSRDFCPVYVALVQNSTCLFHRLVSGFYWNISLSLLPTITFQIALWRRRATKRSLNESTGRKTRSPTSSFRNTPRSSEPDKSR